MTQDSNIKLNHPEVYQFFLVYWDFAKKYWEVVADEDWWNSFVSDYMTYTMEYGENNFFMELLQLLFEKNKSNIDCGTKADMVAFLKEWWAYVNEFYETIEEAEFWKGFFTKTKEMQKKYKNNFFYVGMIDLFVDMKV